MIRLQTAARRNIPNSQLSELSAFERNWASTLGSKYNAAKFRTPASPMYNCHGLTFASRRTRITEISFIAQILADDQYVQVEQNDVIAGDIVIYYTDDGDPSHSGTIVANERPLCVPVVCSKWGSGPEVVHSLFAVPDVYGRNIRFYRCKL